MGAPGLNEEAGEPRHAKLKRRLPADGHVCEDGYRYAGMPPISSRIMIANGQQSTDSLSAARLVKSPRTSDAAEPDNRRVRRPQRLSDPAAEDHDQPRWKR